MRGFDTDASWSRSGRMCFGSHTSYYSRAVIVEDDKKCAFVGSGKNIYEADNHLQSFLKDGCICWNPNPSKVCPVHAEEQG